MIARPKEVEGTQPLIKKRIKAHSPESFGTALDVASRGSVR